MCLKIGIAAAPWDTKNVDWVPTLNLSHEKFDASSAASKCSERTARLRERKRRHLTVRQFLLYTNY